MNGAWDWSHFFCCPKLQGCCSCVRKYRSFIICSLQSVSSYSANTCSELMNIPLRLLYIAPTEWDPGGSSGILRIKDGENFIKVHAISVPCADVLVMQADGSHSLCALASCFICRCIDWWSCLDLELAHVRVIRQRTKLTLQEHKGRAVFVSGGEK